MVSQNTQALFTSSAGGALAVTQYIGIKQLVDKTVSIKPLGSYSSSLFKGLNEWTTIASLLGGFASLGYVLYDVEHKRQPLSDLNLALGSYGIVSLTSAIFNIFLDPLGNTPLSLNLGAIKSAFSGLGKTLSNDVSTATQALGKFIR
jgi:hypothetical protein